MAQLEWSLSLFLRPLSPSGTEVMCIRQKKAASKYEKYVKGMY